MIKTILFPRRKKGVFMAIYLPIITLFMCFLVMGLYALQRDKIDNSLASPAAVLRMVDQKEVFEVYEKIAIKDSANSALQSNAWGSNEFKEDLKNKFFAKMQGNEFLGLDKAAIEKIYSFSFENSNLVIERKPLTKQQRVSGDKSKINFVIDVSYTFSKTYKFERNKL